MTNTKPVNLVLDVQVAVPSKGIPEDDELHQWIATALNGRRERAIVSVRICNRQEIQTLNREYRRKDYPTNVLSFPFDLPPGMEGAALEEVWDEDLPGFKASDLLGDLIICADIVAQEAKEQEKTSQEHWAHMVIHGTLHLLGYDHINDDEAEEMESLETRLLASLGFADPYVEK